MHARNFRHRTTRLAGAFGLAALTCLALTVAPDVRATGSDDVRTFEVTCTGDDDVPEEGTATATLTKTAGDSAYYNLTRTVTGPSSDYSNGTAVMNIKTHKIVVTFEKGLATTAAAPPVGPRTGVNQVLGAVDSAEASGRSVSQSDTPEGADAATTKAVEGTTKTTVNLAPTRPDQYIFDGTWSSGNYHFREEWRELTHLTAGITIRSPLEDYQGEPGASVSFVADVKKASRVEFVVDGTVLKTFPNAGHLTYNKKLYVPGFRHFTVNAYGAPTRTNSKGELLGTADSIFQVGGLQLTPADGTKVHGGVARTLAPPVGLPSVKTVAFYVDNKKITTVSASPWGVDLHFPSTGEKQITAVGYDASGKQVAEAQAKIDVVDLNGTAPTTTPSPSPSELPTPAAPPKATALTGSPSIEQTPANPRNYAHNSTNKTMIVIHKAEGSLDATVSWFKNSAARVSAHYTVDDNTIAQSLPDSAVAWHTGNHKYNEISIGIENSGYTDKNDFSEAHYRRLAQLVAYLCQKHSIPMDRSHIIGHNEVPDPDHPGRFGGAGNHTDPGKYFDWSKFMSYVEEAAGSP